MLVGGSGRDVRQVFNYKCRCGCTSGRNVHELGVFIQPDGIYISVYISVCIDPAASTIFTDPAIIQVSTTSPDMKKFAADRFCA